LDGDLSIIRSGALKKALGRGDELVTEVMRQASEVLGHACLTVRHLIDPDVIVLGGGVLEACSDFIMPIVENIVGSDQLPGARPGGRVLLSALGDDAVVLGALALARKHVGRDPFKKEFATTRPYPDIIGTKFGEVTVGSKTHERDIYITVDGRVKKRKKAIAKERYGSSHVIGPEELGAVCKGGPEVLFIGAGHSGRVELNEEGQRFLAQRMIEFHALPTPEIVDAYNESKQRKAALIHVTC
jgi:glucokinase